MQRGQARICPARPVEAREKYNHCEWLAPGKVEERLRRQVVSARDPDAGGSGKESNEEALLTMSIQEQKPVASGDAKHLDPLVVTGAVG